MTDLVRHAEVTETPIIINCESNSFPITVYMGNGAAPMVNPRVDILLDYLVPRSWISEVMKLR